MSDSATAKDYDRAMGAMDSTYTMYGGTRDPTLMAILRLLESKLGIAGGSPLSAMLTEGMMAMQSALGFNNQGMAMAANVSASMQRHGALTGTLGAPGFLGGRDVATYYASQALLKQQEARFIDPLTGIPNARAQNLNSQELGQALNLTMRSGYQYTSGMRIDKDPNGKGSIVSNADKFNKHVDEAVTTMRLMKEVMGSGALENLEKSMSELFGGNMNQFGQTAAKMRLLHIKAMGNTYFGGNMDQAFNYSVNGSALGIAQGLGGPNMSDAEARYRFGTYASHSAAMVDRLSLAGGRASAANSAILTPYGGGVLRDRPADVVGQARIDQETGIYTESDSLVAAADAALKAKVMGNTDAMAEYEKLAQDLVAAGGDPTKIDAANAALNSFVYKTTGRSVGQIDIEKLRQDNNVQGLVSPTVQKMVEQRNQEWIGNTMADEHVILGVDNSEEGRVLGLGAANLSTEDFTALQQNLQDENWRGMAELLGKDSVQVALKRAGVKPEEFSKLMTSGDPQTRARATALARSMAERELDSFVGTGEQAKSSEEMLTSYIRSIEGGERNEGDWMSELLKGAYGVETFTDAQLMDSVDPLLKREFKTGPDGKPIVDDSNLKAYQRIFKGEEGVPTGSVEELQAYLNTAEGALHFVGAAKGKGRVMHRANLEYDGLYDEKTGLPNITENNITEIQERLKDMEGVKPEHLTSATALRNYMNDGDKAQRKAKREEYRKHVGRVTDGTMTFMWNEDALTAEADLQNKVKEQMEQKVKDLTSDGSNESPFSVDAAPTDLDYQDKWEESLNKAFSTEKVRKIALGKLNAGDASDIEDAGTLLKGVGGQLDKRRREQLSEEVEKSIKIGKKEEAKLNKAYTELENNDGASDEKKGKASDDLALQQQRLEKLRELQESLKDADEATKTGSMTVNADVVTVVQSGKTART